MIDFAQIRTDVLTGLCNYLRQVYADILVIEANPGAKEPLKPFLIMNFTSPYIPEGIQAIEETAMVAHPEPEWDYDVEYTRYSNDTMSCSFSIYGENPDQAVDIGLLAQRWFKFDGWDYLKSKGIIVVDCMALQNRDVYIIDSWQRRQGFDVIFRVLSKVKKVVPTTETVDLIQKEGE